MIAVRLEGRLGNQLFQYAFIYTLAKKLGVSFHIDQSVQRFVLDEYFDVPKLPFASLQQRVFNIKGFKNLFSHHLKRSFYLSINKILGLKPTIFDNKFTEVAQSNKYADKALYLGYFQSENYFKNNEDQIKNLFRIKPKYQQQYMEEAGSLLSAPNLAVVHVRRGDYLALNIGLPISYYHKAIAQVKATIPDTSFVFISDDPKFIEQEFIDIKDKYVSHHTEIIDLQLLMNADTLILSNSSFSWWGAWLNNKPHKQVYAPKNWMGSDEAGEYPKGISDGLNYNWIN